MKYIKIFWIIAIILFVLPFLGIPQSVKDFLIICIAFVIGFLAWMRQAIIMHKRRKLHALYNNNQETIDEQ